MISRLQAEEMLAGVHVGALGGGRMKSFDLKQAIGELRRATGAPLARPSASPAGLSALGIGVRMVPKK